MKIKGRLGLWLLIPAWILAFAARLTQIIAGTDMEHGFLKDDNGVCMNFCFWGAVILTLAAGIAAAHMDGDTPKAERAEIVRKFRDGEIVTADNLALVCSLLDCQPGDILEYVQDENED